MKNGKKGTFSLYLGEKYKWEMGEGEKISYSGKIFTHGSYSLYRNGIG